MNHRVNAIVHHLPECPECGAEEEKACVTVRGMHVEREPHDIRLRIARGEVFVLEVEDARAINKVRELRELGALIMARRKMQRALAEPRKPARISASSYSVLGIGLAPSERAKLGRARGRKATR